MKNLTNDEAVLLGLLSLFKRPILRTKLVKLIYLLDNSHSEHFGRQITNFKYHWDHHGPNAVGSAIVKTLSALAQKELVAATEYLTSYENYATLYKASESVDASKLPLTDSDWVLIYAVFEQHGRKSRESIVAESKRTAPMAGAHQYEILEFSKNPSIETLKQSFFTDKAFVEETKRALASSSGKRISLDELRAEVAEPAVL